MGCFLGCFGISSKRKRRKPANRILPGPADSKLVSYEPLDSSNSANLDIPEEPITSNSELSNKPKESSRVKIRKKVSFNLNVQTYEPIPAEETTTYHFLQSVEEDEEESEKNQAEAGNGSFTPLSERDSNSSNMGSHPRNYRYQNCRESYDEEDEMMYEESDLEDDDYFDDYYDDDYGDYGDNDKDVDDQRPNMESAKGASLIQLDKDKAKNHQMPLCASTNGELQSLGCGNASIRSQYPCSVLNPVENTTQWKEVKARAAPPKQWRKENTALQEEPQITFSSELRSNCSPNYNQSKPLLQDIAVDASLSNWLISSNTDEPKTTGNSIKSCSIPFDTLPSKKSISDSSFSWRSREDRVILDITNLDKSDALVFKSAMQ